MIRRIGIILLATTILAGCSKKDEGTAAQAPPSSSAVAQIGDAAEPLTGLTWVKGEPVDVGAGKVMVVEFWATWCPPCRQSVPHLTALQAKYKDDIVVVGVSTEAEAKVRPFVEQMGEKMAYHVAVDASGKVGGGYMTAYQQNSIPTAFLVDAEGKVRWVGHPMALDPILDQVVSGTYAAL